MKLLLDENLTHELRNRLDGHAVFTVQYMKWSGISNGELLSLARDAGFDALITKDHGLSYQHNLASLPIAVVIVRAASNDISDIEPVIPALRDALAALRPKSLVIVA